MKLVFIDESGNPKISCRDRDNPYFALTATIFNADYYFYIAEGIIDTFKEKWFGSSDHILHFRDIVSKRNGVYSFMRNGEKRVLFTTEINNLIKSLDFECCCILINLEGLQQQYGRFATNPLILAHQYLGERLQKDCCRLAKKTQRGRVFVEECNYSATGITKEEFINYLRDDIVLNSPNIRGYHLSPKKENLTGIQISDLCANPLRRHIIGAPFSVIDPNIILNKIVKNPTTGKTEGWGWKVFP